MVMSKALNIPEVVEVIEFMERNHRMNSPFDSVFKLCGITRKTRLPEQTAWVFQTIRDRVSSGAMATKEFAYRPLVGDGAGGGRGLVDLYLLKLDMRKYALSTLLDRMEAPSDVKQNMAKVLKSHLAYRRHLNPLSADKGGGEVDLSWRRGWKRSSITFQTFIEDIVYSDAYDSTLRTAARASKTPADVMEYESFKTKWQEVQALRAKEQEEERKADLPASSAEAQETTGPDAAAGKASGAAAEKADGSAEKTDDGDKLQQEALRQVNANITLKIEPESQVDLKAALMASPVASIFGTEHKSSPQSNSAKSGILRIIIAALMGRWPTDVLIKL